MFDPVTRPAVGWCALRIPDAHVLEPVAGPGVVRRVGSVEGRRVVGTEREEHRAVGEPSLPLPARQPGQLGAATAWPQLAETEPDPV